MGFCSEEQYRKFLKLCTEFEKYIVDGGIKIIKYWMGSARRSSNADLKLVFGTRFVNGS